MNRLASLGGCYILDPPILGSGVFKFVSNTLNTPDRGEREVEKARSLDIEEVWDWK